MPLKPQSTHTTRTSSVQLTTKTISKPRLAWVDLFETLAIFAVVFYHATSSIATLDFLTATSPHFFIFYFFRSILAVCVPIFFFANGFLLFRKPTFDLKSHLRKTLKFFFIAIVWYLITLIFLLFLHRSEFSLSDPLSALTAVKSGVNHLWYLGALVCIYLFYPLLKTTYDHHPSAFLFFTILCCVLAFGNSLLNEAFTIISHFFTSSHAIYTDTNFFSIFNPLRGLYAFSFTYFCLGGLASRYLPRLLSIPTGKRNFFAIITLFISWIALFGLGLLYSTTSGQIWDNVWFGYDSIFTFIATFALFLLCQNYTAKCPLVITISKNTLGIYLIHTLLIAAFANLFRPEFLTNFSSPLLLVANLLYTTLILALSLLFSLILRRLPFLRQLVS